MSAERLAEVRRAAARKVVELAELVAELEVLEDRSGLPHFDGNAGYWPRVRLTESDERKRRSMRMAGRVSLVVKRLWMLAGRTRGGAREDAVLSALWKRRLADERETRAWTKRQRSEADPSA